MSAAGVFRRMPVWQKIVSTIFPALCREQGWRSLGNQRTKRRLPPLSQSVRKARLGADSFHHASVRRSDDEVSSAKRTASRQKTGCPRADSPYPYSRHQTASASTDQPRHLITSLPFQKLRSAPWNRKEPFVQSLQNRLRCSAGTPIFSAFYQKHEAKFGLRQSAGPKFPPPPPAPPPGHRRRLSLRIPARRECSWRGRSPPGRR